MKNKVFLLLNGKMGWQTGIEDGFGYLKIKGEIDELEWFYYDDFSLKNGKDAALREIVEICQSYLPTLIVIFHINKFPITSKYITFLKSIASSPIIAYDEGDMYGSWAKPVTPQMRDLIKCVDIVSIRGLGKFYNVISELNKNVIYTPNHADIARFDKEPCINIQRDNKLILIGNKNKPKAFSLIRRLPGASGREKLVQCLGKAFKDEFKIYGNGWDGFVGNQGPVDFQDQLEVFRNTWITVSYEHYPDVPYFFSNRLPIALLAGSLFVCHYHQGYDKIFKGQDFIFFFKSNDEAIDVINYVLSLSKEDLIDRSLRARNFALNNYHPNVVWSKFYSNVMDCVAYKRKYEQVNNISSN
ncbi:glycosyltransferase family protein [Pontibacter cellulosilyticus]|uniref:Glycosyltransferase n=1 Tax=Pontibacter cellulosilyticus TaxID=1720253 RepID=A0A923N670_9BACT|nr:glycosyltransferase [Pontibacter cellulosilyticus]MBC5992534.1 glycosyltransferase [Pontibacter cellulosilyticus]